MPYVCAPGGVYLGEHTCGRYHYGRPDVVRDCCVEDYRQRLATRLAVALTPAHPAARLEEDAWSFLTDAERALLREPVAVQ